MSVLITGSQSDIAQALTRELVNLGEKVILTCSSSESLAKSQKYFKEAKLIDKVELVEFNLSKSKDMMINISNLFQGHQIHGLVLNAWMKVEALKMFEEISDEDLNEELNGNIRGNADLIKCILPHMKENNLGRILFISSVSAISGMSQYGLYCMGKAAIEGLITNIAVDYGRFNITANSLRPGITKTKRTQRFWEREYYAKRMASGILLEKLGEPEQVARACLPFLDRESYITGTSLNVSGGLPLVATKASIKSNK